MHLIQFREYAFDVFPRGLHVFFAEVGGGERQQRFFRPGLAQVDPVGLAVDGVIHEPLRQQDAPSVGGAFRHRALEHLHQGLRSQVLVQRKTSEGHERRANKDACLEAISKVILVCA